MLHVTFHRRQQPQTFPLLTPPLCTVGWFSKMEAKKNQKKFKNQQTVETFQKKGLISFFNFSNTLLDQKSPALLVPVANGGARHKRQTTVPQTLRLYRLNPPKGQFSENPASLTSNQETKNGGYVFFFATFIFFYDL